jgi:hypothetical protein
MESYAKLKCFYEVCFHSSNRGLKRGLAFLVFVLTGVVRRASVYCSKIIIAMSTNKRTRTCTNG